MKDLNEKKWKIRQKCIRPNMALFWNQNISCWSLDRRAKRIREKRRREEKEKKKKKEEGEEKFKKDQRYGIVCMDFFYGFLYGYVYGYLLEVWHTSFFFFFCRILVWFGCGPQ